MKLADPILVTIAGEEIELNPSLRCAMQLERRDGSFRQLLAEINDGSLSAAVAIIEPHADGMPFLKNRVLDELPTLKPALIAYVLRCTGIDPDEAPTGDKSKGQAQPFYDYLTSLYRIGTGWLGWSPETTLDATPAEIIEANKGRMEMLKAIFGSGEKDKPKDNRPLEEKFRTVFAGFGTRKEAA
ncbi:hypothetical protein N7379_02750 [Rhizobium pusense]|uniref:hypothetical protein n=1 Tax=Agrobacterium pusense TaxID=648995 RepID=UPI0024492D40|nr:hypothetical protein [Agrobacterium pusense]MDH0113384.1 hypothetical protein [Agrobacterium pusense]